MTDFNQIATTYALTGQSDISAHAHAIIREFYHQPYKNQKPKNKIARPIHGGQHTSRVALDAEVFTKLYRRYGDERALKLTDEDLFYIQIAALFHDAAREDDDEDRWDKESAALCFKYLVEVLKLHPKKAQIYAHAIANKDYQPGGEYHHLIYDPDTKKVTWLSANSTQAKSIEETIIQNADCLDVMRCYDTNYKTLAKSSNMFDGTRLDFYQDFAKKNDWALYELGNVLNESRAMIHRQGDGVGLMRDDIKLQFEYAENCFSKTKEDAKSGRIYNQLCTGSVASIHDNRAVDLLMSEVGSIQRDLEMGKIFFRGIYHVSAVVLKERENNLTETNETFAEFELRKLLRRGEKHDADGKPKIGNPLRSVTQVGYGSIAFAPTGYLFASNPSKIQMVSATDAGTGYGKKEHLQAREVQSSEKLQCALYDMHKKNMLSAKYSHSRDVNTHSEMLYHIDKVDGIYFSLGKTHNDIVDDADQYYNPLSAQLQALYMQQMHFVKTNGELLPIYSYDPIGSVIKMTPLSFKNKNELIALWKNLITSHVAVNQYKDAIIFNNSLETLKTLACYGRCEHRYWHKPSVSTKLLPLDRHYNSALKAEIDEALSICIKELKDTFYREIHTKLSAEIVPDDDCLLYIVYHDTDLAEKYLHRFRNKIDIAFIDQPNFTVSELYSNVFRCFAPSVNTINRLGSDDLILNRIHVLDQSHLVKYYLMSKKINDTKAIDHIRSKIRKLIAAQSPDNFVNLILTLKTFDLYDEFKDRVFAWMIAQEIRLDKDDVVVRIDNLLEISMAIKMNAQTVLDKVTPLLSTLIKNPWPLSYMSNSNRNSADLAFTVIRHLYEMIGNEPCPLLDDFIAKVSQITFPIFGFNDDRAMFFKVLMARNLNQNKDIFLGLIKNINSIPTQHDLDKKLKALMQNVQALMSSMPSFSVKEHTDSLISEFLKLLPKKPFIKEWAQMMTSYAELGTLLALETDRTYLDTLAQLCKRIDAALLEMKTEGEEITDKKIVDAFKKLDNKIDKALFISLSPSESKTARMTLN